MLHFWCAHQYLYKAGSPQVSVDESARWTFLRAWYVHMRSVQQFIDQPEISACLRRSSFPFNENSTDAFSNWTYKAIGNSTAGEEPKLLFNSATGLVHLPSFVFSHPLRHSRRNIAPKNRACIPLPDRSCWPTTAVWQADSCSLCCDPNKGPFGDASCWRNGRTYERCCQQDFKNVKCEEIRKSTPGCLDCAQSLSFFCEEHHKFDAVKAWQLMNHTWHEYLGEQNNSATLRTEVAGNTTLVAEWHKAYLEILPDMVRAETEWMTVSERDDVRLARSVLHAENDTLAWLMRDVRKPIFGNFTIVKRVRK